MVYFLVLCLSFLSPTLGGNVWRYVFVADFRALTNQVTTTFDTNCAARIRTTPAIKYTACYALAVLVSG